MPKNHPCYKLHRWLNKAANAVMMPTGAFTFVCVAIPIVAFLSAAAIGLLQFCDHGKEEFKNHWFGNACSAFYEQRLGVSITVVAVQALCGISAFLLRLTQPIQSDNAQQILTLATDHVFRNMDRDRFEYRATVFKIRGIRWLTGQWLGIVCRSGETYDKSGTIFFVDRQAPRNSTGFGGRCYANSGLTISTTEPLTVGDASAYMQECGLAECEHANMNVKSIVLHATGLQRKGKLWGVLVFDTTDPEQLPAANRLASRHNDVNAWAAAVGLMIR